MCSMTLILDPLQSSASLQQFQSAWSDLFDDILSTEVNPATNEVCSCGTGGLRKYRCTDSGCLCVSKMSRMLPSSTQDCPLSLGSRVEWKLLRVQRLV